MAACQIWQLIVDVTVTERSDWGKRVAALSGIEESRTQGQPVGSTDGGVQARRGGGGWGRFSVPKAPHECLLPTKAVTASENAALEILNFMKQTSDVGPSKDRLEADDRLEIFMES